jgi:hypothetical protein
MAQAYGRRENRTFREAGPPAASLPSVGMKEER